MFLILRANLSLETTTKRYRDTAVFTGAEWPAVGVEKTRQVSFKTCMIVTKFVSVAFTRDDRRHGAAR